MSGPMSSQGTKILLSDSTTELAITAASKAAPCVLTVTGTVTAVVNDWVFVADTGFASLDNRWWKLSAVAAQALTLAGSDTTGETTAGNRGTVTQASGLIEICLASLSRDSPAAATLDVTTLCDTSRQQRSGMKNNGTWTAQGFYDPGSAGQQQLRQAYDLGDDRMLKIVPPDLSEIIFMTQVNQLSESFAVDQPVQVTAGGVVMGAPQYVLPPGATPLMEAA